MADIVKLFNDSNLEKTRYTVTLVTQGQKVLLGLKKRGFGVGKWNGFGGKIEPGETVAQGACRELNEESGLVATLEDIKHVGTMHMKIGQNKYFEIFVFSCSEYSGEPTETDEMLPRWFSTSQLPYEDMWSEARIWFPLFLANKLFTAWFTFDDNYSLERFHINEHLN